MVGFRNVRSTPCLFLALALALGTGAACAPRTDKVGKASSGTARLDVTNTAPTVSSISAVSMLKSDVGIVNTLAVSFTISDDETSSSRLTVTASSSNTTVFPNNSTYLALSGSSGSRTLTLRGANGQTGSATITVSVSDGSLTTTTTFVATVYDPTVAALYSTNGAKWNDYVKDDGVTLYTGTDTACSGATAANACLHGGEYRKITLYGYTSCSTVSATDSLGAFSWTCSVVGSTATVISTGLASSKGLWDLMKSDGSAFNDNSVTVTRGGSTIATTTAGVWWSNTVTALPDNSATSLTTLSSASTIYTLDSNRNTLGYNLNADKIAVVVKPGRTLTFIGGATVNTATGETAGANARAILGIGANHFAWVEGTFAGGNLADRGFYAYGSHYLRVHRATFQGIKGTTGADGSAGANAADGADGQAGNNSVYTGTCYDSGGGVYLPFVSGPPTPVGSGDAAPSGSPGSDGSAGGDAYGVSLVSSSYGVLTSVTVSSVTGGTGGAGGAGGNGGKGGRPGSCVDAVTIQCADDGSWHQTDCQAASSENGAGGDGGSAGQGGAGGIAYGLQLSSATLARIDALSVATLVNGTGGAAGAVGTGGANGDAALVTLCNCDPLGMPTTTPDPAYSPGVGSGAAGSVNVAGSAGTSTGVILTNSTSNAFKTTLDILNTPTNKCTVSGGTLPGLVNNSCTSSGTDGSSDYPVGTLSDAVLNL